MDNSKRPGTMDQLRQLIGSDGEQNAAHTTLPAPAASPLGTDDEAAGTTPTADRIAMAQEAEQKIDAAAKRTADDAAHAQRGSSAPYSKEEHMNEELAKQKERVEVEGDPAEQPS